MTEIYSYIINRLNLKINLQSKDILRTAEAGGIRRSSAGFEFCQWLFSHPPGDSHSCTAYIDDLSSHMRRLSEQGRGDKRCEIRDHDTWQAQFFVGSEELFWRT